MLDPIPHNNTSASGTPGTLGTPRIHAACSTFKAWEQTGNGWEQLPHYSGHARLSLADLFPVSVEWEHCTQPADRAIAGVPAIPTVPGYWCSVCKGITPGECCQ